MLYDEDVYRLDEIQAKQKAAYDQSLSSLPSAATPVFDDSKLFGIVLGSEIESDVEPEFEPEELPQKKRVYCPHGDKKVSMRIYMRIEEKEFLAAMASRAGMSVSELARESMMEYVLRHRLYTND